MLAAFILAASMTFEIPLNFTTFGNDPASGIECDDAGHVRYYVHGLEVSEKTFKDKFPNDFKGHVRCVLPYDPMPHNSPYILYLDK